MPKLPVSIPVTVSRIVNEADDIISLELRAHGETVLPPFEAGAHIDIKLPLPSGVEVRQYSLCNDPAENDRYVIAVGLDANSRGGSRWLHEHVRQGDVLHIGEPRNNFPLVEDAPQTVLIAGGIGITPLLAMARRLTSLGRKWTLYYCVRTPKRAAFLEKLLALGSGEVVPVFDGMPGVSPLDVVKACAQMSMDTHLYCCGPTGLLQAFTQATRARPSNTTHVEWFAAPAQSTAAPAADNEFDVHLARTQCTLHVPADKTILDVLLDAGLDVPYSCTEGICASCETRVLSGECDHRDFILTPDQASANDRIMICVSRCKGKSLTLEL